MSEINTWDKVASNNNSSPPNGWPENMNYSEVNNSARENMAATARLYADMNGTLVSTGSSNSYTLTPNRTLAAYSPGLEFVFVANNTNTGAATLNVSSLGAKDIKNPDGTAISSGHIASGEYYRVIYSGVHFVLFPYVTAQGLSLKLGDAPSDGLSYGRKDGAWVGLGALAVGDVVAHAARTPPYRTLECDGSTISRTTYSDLFSVIGTTFGSGNGSSTFKIPDLRGEFIRGWANGRGVDSGRSFGSFQGDSYKSHNHSYTTYGSTGLAYTQSGVFFRSPTTSNSGSSGGTETRPRNQALMYCIKY
jgi:microcystin-dependent protein